MLPTHFVTTPILDGYSWTLTTRLGAILCEIESLYGLRDKSWTVLGIEFSPDGPQLWFPGNCGNIAIQLGTNALVDTGLACYQLAHEAVHLLAPDGKADAPVIEEGLATVFSEDYVVREFSLESPTRLPSYIDAAKKVRELLAVDPVAISSLRSVEPSFKKMSASTFSQAGLEAVPQELINDLLHPFQREKVAPSHGS